MHHSLLAYSGQLEIPKTERCSTNKTQNSETKTPFFRNKTACRFALENVIFVSRFCVLVLEERSVLGMCSFTFTFNAAELRNFAIWLHKMPLLSQRSVCTLRFRCHCVPSYVWTIKLGLTHALCSLPKCELGDIQHNATPTNCLTNRITRQLGGQASRRPLQAMCRPMPGTLY